MWCTNLLGDYGYVANVIVRDNRHTAKIVAKIKAFNAHMDTSILRERMILASMEGLIFSTYYYFLF